MNKILVVQMPIWLGRKTQFFLFSDMYEIFTHSNRQQFQLIVSVHIFKFLKFDFIDFFQIFI